MLPCCSTSELHMGSLRNLSDYQRAPQVRNNLSSTLHWQHRITRKHFGLSNFLKTVPRLRKMLPCCSTSELHMGSLRNLSDYQRAPQVRKNRSSALHWQHRITRKHFGLSNVPKTVPQVSEKRTPSHCHELIRATQ